jgi:hypothetical protein
LSNSQFRTVWSRACYYNLKNLLLEVVLRGDLELDDYGAAYGQIGDFGLRRLLYYSKLESDLAMRRSTTQVAYEGRTALLLGNELTKSVGPAITKWEEDGQSFQDWQVSLHFLHPYVTDTNWVQCLVGNAKARQLDSKLVDYHPSSYVAAFSLAAKRVETNLAVVDPMDIPIFNCSREVEFAPGPLSPKLISLFPNLEKWTLPQEGLSQLGDDYYLGNWENLFHTPEDVFPTWAALVWVGKDHAPDIRPPTGLLANKRDHAKHTKTDLAPPQVREDPRFCSQSIRRYPWFKTQKLDDVWYNFCLMEGEFDTWEKCVIWFSKFSELHRHHRDPVCFRQALFAAICAEWCVAHSMCIDPRVGARCSQDIAIFLKLQYLNSKQMRLLELMCLTDFLVQPHNVIAMEPTKGSSDTRRGPAQNFMNHERRTRQEITELGRKELKLEQEWIARFHSPIGQRRPGSASGSRAASPATPPANVGGSSNRSRPQ